MNTTTKAPEKPVETASVWTQLRVKPSEKARWVAAAERSELSLTKWITAILNERVNTKE